MVILKDPPSRYVTGSFADVKVLHEDSRFWFLCRIPRESMRTEIDAYGLDRYAAIPVECFKADRDALVAKAEIELFPWWLHIPPFSIKYLTALWRTLISS